MTNGIVSGYFAAGDEPKTGLADVVFDIEQVPLSGGAPAMFGTGLAAVEGALGGFYHYHSSSFDTTLYKYNIVARTADATVDVQKVPGSMTLLENSITNQIAPEVWDAASDSYIQAGSTGERLQQAAAASSGGQLTLITKQSTALSTNTVTTSGTDANIDEADEIAWVLGLSAGAEMTIDITFNCSNLYLQELNYVARHTGNRNNYLNILAYHPVNLTWDIISTPATQINANLEYIFHRISVGQEYVAGNGDVIIRVHGTGLVSSPSTYLDYFALLTSTEGGYVLTASEVAEAVVQSMPTAVYGNKVYIDPENGVDGFDYGVSGTAQFPVKTLTYAKQIADAIKTQTIVVEGNTTLTLDQNVESYQLTSKATGVANMFTIDLAGFSISGSSIEGAAISGLYTAALPTSFRRCELGDLTGPPGTLHQSWFTGTYTIDTQGTLLAVNCLTSPSIADAREIVLQADGMDVDIYGMTGDLVISGIQTNTTCAITGEGAVTIGASSTGGTLYVNGSFLINDLAGAAVTILDDRNFSRPELIDDYWNEELSPDHLTAGTTGGHLYTRASQASVDLIPTDPLLSGDSRLDYLDAAVSGIPTNPLLTNDARVDFLDAAVSGIPTNPLLTNDARVDYLDVAVSSRASQASVDLIPTDPLQTSDPRLDYLDAAVSGIPTNPLLTDDIRVDNLDAPISTRATQAGVDAIPTNPLLTNDVRLDFLDASVSGIPTNPLLTDDIRLDFIDVAISSRASQVSVDALPTVAEIWQEPIATHEGVVGSMAEALALASVGGGGSDPDIVAAAVWDKLSADHILAGSFGLLMKNTLTVNDSRLDYLDASIASRATQTSVDLIPTNPLLTTDGRLDYLDIAISTRATQTSVNAIPTNPLLTNDARLNNLDVTVSSRATQTSVDALPTLAEIWQEPIATHSGVVGSMAEALEDASAASTYLGPSVGEIADGVWDEDLDPDHITVGTAGYWLDGNLKVTDSRLNYLDATISSRATQTSVNAIPTNPLLTNDARLNNLDVTVSSRATQVSVDAIPTVAEIWQEPIATHSGVVGSMAEALDDASMESGTDPALTAAAVWNKLGADHVLAGSFGLLLNNTLKDDDGRLDYLDASIASRATQTSVDLIPTNPLLANDARLNNLDASIASRATQVSVDALPTVAEIWQELLATHSGVTGSMAEALETAAIGGVYLGPTTQEIVDGVWDEPNNLHTVENSTGWYQTNVLLKDDARLDYLDATISSRATAAAVSLIPTNPLLSVDPRVDFLDIAVSTRATQSSVDTIPTNPLLTDDVRLDYLDASIAAIPITPLLTDDVRLDTLDVAISTRADQVTVDAIKLKTDNIPDNPVDVSDLDDVVKRVLTSGIGQFEDEAEIMSLIDLIAGAFKAKIDSASKEMVLYKTTGAELRRIQATLDPAAEPIIAVGVIP